MKMWPPRLLIAGTHSGVGKTTITTGIIAALRARGLEVQPFKVGPDYIDPTYHTLAAGRPARTLDTWMVPPERVPALFTRAVQGADIAVIEGVMGLYDAADYEGEAGSAAEVAKLLAVPVVLVVDARAMARSAAALVLGYREFDPAVPLAGVIVNRVAGKSHGEGVAQAITRATGLSVFGWIPRDDALHIPERHLGLVPTAEPGRWDVFVQAAATLVARHLDLDALLAMAQYPHPVPATPRVSPGPKAQHGPGPVIAVARDEAFSFTYVDNLDLLQDAGARLAFFSPLRDEALPPETAAIILSGGFPEVYAPALAENRALHQALREAHARGIPIYAECGGLMYLTETIVDQEGRAFPMVGLLPGRSVMTGRLTLGYRVAEAAGDSWFLRAGERVRGHEFHYSVWEGRPANLPPAYRLVPRRGQGPPREDGARLGNLWATYVHLHFWSMPALAVRFVRAAQGHGWASQHARVAG